MFRYGLVAVLLGMALPASAQPLPPGTNTETGARPGNEIGTGSSLPFSDKASNISPGDTTSVIAPNLPSPPIGENASVRDYLARRAPALLRGRTGEATAGTRDGGDAGARSFRAAVPTNVPTNPLIGEIERALHALSAGDRGVAVQTIEIALSHAQ